MLVTVTFPGEDVRVRCQRSGGVVIIRSGQDKVGRRSWTRTLVQNLQWQPMVTSCTLHVALGQVGSAVISANAGVAIRRQIRRLHQRWTVGWTHANAVFATSSVLAIDSFTQIYKRHGRFNSIDRNQLKVDTKTEWGKYVPQSPCDATTMNCCLWQADCFNSHSLR